MGYNLMLLVYPVGSKHMYTIKKVDRRELYLLLFYSIRQLFDSLINHYAYVENSIKMPSVVEEE
jgi:hypothetical protein